jgi:5-methylcytosine-specific restriction protein A
MSRTEFSAKVKRQSWERCKGFCEGCTAKLYPGRFDYDHDKPDGLDGEPTLENCKVLCTTCHGIKTHTVDRPIMQKADNIKAKHLGFKKSGRGFRKAPPGYSYWTRRIET